MKTIGKFLLVANFACIPFNIIYWNSYLHGIAMIFNVTAVIGLSIVIFKKQK